MHCWIKSIWLNFPLSFDYDSSRRTKTSVPWATKDCGRRPNIFVSIRPQLWNSFLAVQENRPISTLSRTMYTPALSSSFCHVIFVTLVMETIKSEWVCACWEIASKWSTETRPDSSVLSFLFLWTSLNYLLLPFAK